MVYTESRARNGRKAQVLAVAARTRVITSVILVLRLGLTERSAQRYLSELTAEGALQMQPGTPRRYQLTEVGRERIAA